MTLPILCDPFYPSFGADLLIAFLGAVLGLGAAYWVYILSIRQVRRDRLKYVVSLIEQIVPSVKRQAGYCEDYAELLIQKPFTGDHLPLEANRDPKRLADKVDQEGVFHAYLWKYLRTKETYKEFQQIYKYIDYIDYLVDDLIKTNERIIMFTWERKKQYQIGFKKAYESIQSLSFVPELQQNQPDLVNYAGSLLERFATNQPQGENIEHSFNTVVEPLREYIVKNGKQHPKITELLFELQDLSNQFNGIELSGKHNAADYKDFAEKLQQASENLFNSTTKLQQDFTAH